MCKQCWEEAGNPRIDNPEVRKAQQLISELYEIHSSGGDLHIVLDDWNVDNESLKFCYYEILLDTKLDRNDRDLHLKVYYQLMKLTPQERISVLALNDNLWR